MERIFVQAQSEDGDHSKTYGMCVDVNECAEMTDGCNTTSEACWNMAGGYACQCNWGYIWDNETSACKAYNFLHNSVYSVDSIASGTWSDIFKFKYNLGFNESEKEGNTYFVDNSEATTTHHLVFFLFISILPLIS
ncbi:hypothetical protein AAG570_006324 [Ranatra chinensis]|uniref:EGF-like calcium-binding domain-containing protein n=1 Tax=Ranatra chinensis TaxID=642074 RepID=A0ABD0YTM4_9HEMI